MKTNVILVFNPEGSHVLMCKRTKDPFKGLYNLVGGKLEKYESDLEAAYRELAEESTITATDIQLFRVITMDYPLDDLQLQIFAGQLREEHILVDEVNPLSWISLEENFYDSSRFAGYGNIGHMLKIIYSHANKLGFVFKHSLL